MATWHESAKLWRRLGGPRRNDGRIEEVGLKRLPLMLNRSSLLSASPRAPKADRNEDRRRSGSIKPKRSHEHAIAVGATPAFAQLAMPSSPHAVSPGISGLFEDDQVVLKMTKS